MSAALDRKMAPDDHGALMDSVYRGQRHIYDATRKYYLFGRDRLIEQLALAPGESVLEIACGTGRNLARIGQRWPGAKVHGLDISHEMLKSAAARLGAEAKLAQADATDFDAEALFGQPQFDRVVISYALSMIPDWQAALAQAAQLVRPGGSLHVVDFGQMEGLAAPLRWAMDGWLARFHVTPRAKLIDVSTALAARQKLTVRTRRGAFDYYRLLTFTRRAAR